MQPDEFPEEFEIDQAPIWPVDDGRLEPIFLAGPSGLDVEEFEELNPKREPDVPEVPPAEFEAVPQLDPERSEAAPEAPQPAPRQRASATGLFGSLGVHLLPLLVLIGWTSAPAELAATIPVRFVVEQPPSGPDEAPDRLATETISETPSRTDNSPADATAAKPERPPPTRTASVAPRPPKPATPAKPVPPQPAAATPPTLAPPPAATSPPAASPAAARPTAPSPAGTTPSPAPREARGPGPAPARSDYFDRLVALTRTHLDLLPRSFLAGRRGQTILSIVVLEDGAIGRISLKRSSGYPDIDARIEQIVAAVGRFPPLPASFDHPSVELDFDLTFPNVLQQ